jgi:hypothetical protein
MNTGDRGGRYKTFAVLAGCAMFVLAYANRLTFPFPWQDDARFFLPALWWAGHLSLEPAILHAPGGIFWVPDGMTVFLGIALRAFGRTIEVARATCECSVALGVAMFALGLRKLAGSWQMGVLATILLLSPPVVFAANMVRMEAPLFLLIAAVLLLHLNGSWLAAGTLLFASLLFHPALGIAAIAYAAMALLICRTGKTGYRIKKLEWLFFALVAIGFIAESVHVLNHLDLFKAHMAYQTARKLASHSHSRFLKPQGAILLLSCAATVTVVVRRRVWEDLRRMQVTLPIAAVALGMLVYAVLGAELPYDVYSLSVSPAIMFCVMSRELCAMCPVPEQGPYGGSYSGTFPETGAANG